MRPVVPARSVLAALACALAATACTDDVVGNGNEPGPDAPDGAVGDPDAPGIPDSGSGCEGTARCEDFETTATGATPEGGWSIVAPNCSGNGVVEVTDAQAHTGAHSLEIRGAAGYCNHVFLATELPADLATVHVRFYVRFDEALGEGHTTFATFRDANAGKDVRMGGQNHILMWNREIDDATLPELSPTGIAQSVAPPADEWHCIEAAIDPTVGTIVTEVGGEIVPGLVVDGTATPDLDAQWLRNGEWRPDLTDFKLGWESYAGQPMTLWFDDVVISASRIGC